jgi:hypothetical protein
VENGWGDGFCREKGVTPAPELSGGLVFADNESSRASGAARSGKRRGDGRLAKKGEGWDLRGKDGNAGARALWQSRFH